MEELFILFIPRFLLAILALQQSFLPSSYNKLKKRKEYKWSERGSCCVV
jgi:hypothetical protein